MLLLGLKIVEKDKSTQGGSAFFLGLLYLLVGLGVPIRPLGVTSLELPSARASGPEEVVTPLSSSGARNLHLPQQDFPPLEATNGLERVTYRIRPGDTLGRLLRHFGLSREKSSFWIRSIQRDYSPKKLRAGREIYLYFIKGVSGLPGKKREKDLKALEIELNEDWVLTWELGDDAIVFWKRERPYEIEIKTGSGAIMNSLYEDGVRSGLHPAVISQLVDIFAWDINFNTDLRVGDSFKIHYKRKYRKGKKKKEIFHILAAEIINQRQKHFAFYFEKEKGRGNYYDLQGRSLARAFLRFPVEFSRISSTFSHDRFNPILKVVRPHHGVDFAAKRGTPVRAVSDGKINHVGWKKGGYGRMIEIQHGAVYTSRYAHLQRFARGIRKGAKVKKGQVIGYVGSSGRSTGPHLHFELYKNKQYINPLKVEFPAKGRIEPPLRKVFENAKRLFLAELAVTPHS